MGAVDSFVQASVLILYDPGPLADAVTYVGEISTWAGISRQRASDCRGIEERERRGIPDPDRNNYIAD